VWAGSFMLSRTSTPLERRIEPYPLGSRVITLTGAKGTIIARFDRYPNPPEYHVRLDGEPHKYHCLHTKIRLEPQ